MNTQQKQNTRNLILRSLAASSLALSLAGCTTGALPGNFGVGTPAATTRFTGNVHGGRQPIAGATIQLYAVGTSGLQSASTALIAAPGVTDSNGNFNITNSYDCTGVTDVYIVAAGGDPGSGTNTTVNMVAALGDCATLQANAANVFINLNEVSTIAAAYVLAPFAADVTHIGAAGVNPTGLVNAFASVNDLYNLGAGTAGSASQASGVTVPTAEIYTLANIIASCVNSAGTGSPACNALFSATGATDTFGAALAIAKNPGAAAITALYVLSTPISPFQPSQNTQPNDYTIALNMTAASGLSTPYGVAIDASGNAWVTNESGSTVTELSPRGAVIATPTATNLFGAQGVAIDRTGNVWIANTAGNSLVRFTVSGGSITATDSFTGAALAAPTSIAADSAGNIFATNFNGNNVVEYSGGSLSTFNASNNITLPTGIAVGSTGNLYITNSGGSVTKTTNAGVFVSTLTDNALQGPVSVALDSSNRVYLTGSTTGTQVSGAVSEFSAAGSSALATPLSTGVAMPSGVATDGASAWVANSISSGSLAQLTFGSTTASSPTAGFGSLNTPVGVAVDASGNVWTANSGSNTVTKFIGLAQPVATPLAANVGP